VEVGHVERNMYRAGGASCTLLQPLLDNQVGLKNMENCPKVSIPLEKVRSPFRWRSYLLFSFSSTVPSLVYYSHFLGYTFTNTSSIHPHVGFLLFLFGNVFWILGVTE
jgi:hypothetical protein